ncbi:hypothetical protein BGZ61DRAFT_441450 [Ilyonectria robusta]|uniref:uncharacterized protein n=1 Tax=Ilyonectria robusta TaxID=1079257 RepID=UPI001E8EC5AE|nr:uncharacterized protein BGZ61DRAFT_441450 [Ilyonectria robusta]KAH8736030.1 hypothetical protein BGZ61DRAFT_441450 [Ilyonectria robusta]
MVRWVHCPTKWAQGSGRFRLARICFRCDWHVKVVAKVLGESQSTARRHRTASTSGARPLSPKTPATEASNCSAVLTRSRQSRSVFVPAFRISHSGPFLRCAVCRQSCPCELVLSDPAGHPTPVLLPTPTSSKPCGAMFACVMWHLYALFVPSSLLSRLNSLPGLVPTAGN